MTSTPLRRRQSPAAPRPRRRRRLALAAIGATTGLAAAGFAVPADAGGPVVVIGAGHVDVVDVAYEDGAFELSVHDESVEPDVERDPSSVVLRVKPQAAVPIPADPAYAFLGTPGKTVWVLPEVQDENLIWPGIAAEEIESGVFVGDQVQLVVTKVNGPDGLSVFDSDVDGTPRKLVDSEDGLPDVVPLTVGAHRHAAWAFEKRGVYCVTYRVKGRLAATGATVTSAPVTLTFTVGV